MKKHVHQLTKQLEDLSGEYDVLEMAFEKVVLAHLTYLINYYSLCCVFQFLFGNNNYNKIHYIGVGFKVKEERDDLHDNFVSAILELQQKSSMKNVLLEKRLEIMTTALEQRDVQVAEVMAATNIDPKAMHSVNKKLEVIL